jgi:hypothetical protein
MLLAYRWAMSTPTQITIYPNAEPRGAAKELYYPSSDKRLAGQRYQAPVENTQSALFGKDGPSFDDLVDTVNPLHHIPVVSSIYSSLTGDKASPAAKLAGGALIGGPLGFLAALGSVIFEQETGHDAAGALVAALSGDENEANTQLAAVEPAPAPVLPSEDTSEAPIASEMAAIAPAVGSTENVAEKYAALAQEVQKQTSTDFSKAIGVGSSGGTSQSDREVLALFGQQGANAQASVAYSKDHFLPYL